MALDALSEDHRTILRLVQFDGLTLGAAAERMGRSREAAKKLYGRALTKLGEALDVRRPSE
jgi:DNA-directed RNA polymerase specialized sigma24 family protein